MQPLASLFTPAPSHCPCGVALCLPFSNRVSLVVGLLSARNADLDLRVSVLEVHGERDDGETGLLGLGTQLANLLAVQQELSRATRLVVGPGSLGVLRDVDVVQPHLTVLDSGIPVNERGPPLAQRLDLGTGEHEARLEGVLDVVVVARAPVLGDESSPFLAWHGYPSSDSGSAAVKPRSTSSARCSASSGASVGSTRTSGSMP